MNQTAQGLAALGRGPDTMLVHMAPEEVAGLQALALKHGGTLTINPETGLAEAGFLKNILPMIAGFALGPAGFGLMSSVGAGLTVGGISALTSGSLEKGLMAGLGAYGGSGLGESLMGAGTNALSSAGANAVVPPAAESIVPQAVVPAASSVAPTSAVSAANVAPDILGGTAGELASAYYPTVPATNAAQVVTTTTPTINLAELGAQAGPSAGDFARFDRAYSAELGAQAGPSTGDFARFDRASSPGLGASQMDKLGAGFNAATASPGAAWEFAKANAYPLGALGIAALSGMDDNKGTPGLSNPGMIRPYTYARTKVPGAFDRTESGPMSSRERQYFNDQYTALTPYKAPGPEYMAEGGPVEAMSDANAIGMNTGYPQADIRTGAYATPYQQPISRDMLPYAGQAQFAEGGSVGGYLFDPKTGLYTRPGGQGATTVSPTGDISGASGRSGGSGDSYSPSGPPPTTTPEEFAEQSARNQQINNALTGLSKMGITGLAMSAINSLFGAPNNYAPVDSLGTSLGGGFGSPAAQGQTSSQSGEGNPGEQPGQTSSDTGVGNPAEGGGDSGYSGGTTGAGNEGGGIGAGEGLAQGGLSALAQGGMSNLGSYSDGGRLLRGPGDGVSDDIPAMIGQKQQARLADGEFVVPARIVSELGNGSTEAGARQLYAMMDRVQKARRKTVGKDKVATNSRAHKLLPA